jgi:predicted enzyme related to lactoylglutathione lyase
MNSKDTVANHTIQLCVFPVKDIAGAKSIYRTLLGTEPYVDSPYYVGFRVGDQEIGLDPNGHKAGLTGPIVYWPTTDIRKTLETLVGAGAQIQQDVRDVGGGQQIAWVKDTDGNVFGLKMP